MKKNAFCFVLFILIFVTTLSPVAAQSPVCSAETRCNSWVEVSGQSAVIPFSGDDSWLSAASSLFKTIVTYSDGTLDGVDTAPSLSYSCSLDGTTFGDCHQEEYVLVGTYTLRITAKQSDTLFYREGFADTQLIISNSDEGDWDGLTISYHGDQANSGTPAIDEKVYAFSDDVIVLGNQAGADGMALTRDGYTFNAWNTKPDASGETYGIGSTFKIVHDLNLYPLWVPQGEAAATSDEISTKSVDMVDVVDIPTQAQPNQIEELTPISNLPQGEELGYVPFLTESELVSKNVSAEKMADNAKFYEEEEAFGATGLLKPDKGDETPVPEVKPNTVMPKTEDFLDDMYCGMNMPCAEQWNTMHFPKTGFKTIQWYPVPNRKWK